MRSLNLKVALVIYGAIYIAQGIVFLVAPQWAAERAGFEELASYVPYFLGIIGGAYIAAGVWFAMTVLDPIQNINGVRFALLWAGLLLIIPLFALGQGYVETSQIIFGVILNAIFVAALLIFYPYRR